MNQEQTESLCRMLRLPAASRSEVLTKAIAKMVDATLEQAVVLLREWPMTKVVEVTGALHREELVPDETSPLAIRRPRGLRCFCDETEDQTNWKTTSGKELITTEVGRP